MKNVLRLYKSMSVAAKASMWYIFCSVMQRGISIITTPIFTRILSTDQYGYVSVYNSWEMIITIFATLNFTAGVYNNAMVKYPNDRDGYTSVLQTWTSIITVCLFVVYLLTQNLWNDIIGLSTPMMIMMFVDILFTAGMSFWTIRNRYEFKYFAVSIVTLLVSILVPIVSIICIHLTDIYKSEAKIFGTVIVHVIIYGIIYILNIKNGKRLIKREYIEYSTKFNIPLIPHYLSQNILNQADRIMIQNMCSLAHAGIYSVAYSAASLINILTSGINASFVPYLYESMRGKRYNKIGNLAIKIELVVGSLCFLFSLFAPELILLLSTEEYREAIWIVPPVSMSALFVMMYSFFTNIEFYFEKNKFIMFASICTAALNILLNYIFITLCGFIAAGYTTLICYIIYSLIQYLFMRRVCKDYNTPNPYNGKLMWGIAILFALLSLVSEILYNYILFRYTVIAILGCLGIVFGIKNKDKLIEFVKR